jgi:hypothetical protein
MSISHSLSHDESSRIHTTPTALARCNQVIALYIPSRDTPPPLSKVQHGLYASYPTVAVLLPAAIEDPGMKGQDIVGSEMDPGSRGPGMGEVAFQYNTKVSALPTHPGGWIDGLLKTTLC